MCTSVVFDARPDNQMFSPKWEKLPGYRHKGRVTTNNHVLVEKKLHNTRVQQNPLASDTGGGERRLSSPILLNYELKI